MGIIVVFLVVENGLPALEQRWSRVIIVVMHFISLTVLGQLLPHCSLFDVHLNSILNFNSQFYEEILFI